MPSAVALIPARAGSQRVLIDTRDKSRGGLLDHLALEYIEELAQECREQDVRLALAGSLSAAAIRALLPLEPEYVGVRGAACRGGRSGEIELAHVKSLAQLLQRTAGAEIRNA